MFLGALNFAICSLQKLMIPSSVAVRPGFKETKAQGVSPLLSSFLATTAASKISGCWYKILSTSTEDIFSPPEIIISLDRSRISI
jgi:hypothetical protein